MTVSIRDVARHAGVSIGTVSRAFNGYEDIRPETRERILQSAKELGYVPNVSARSLSAKRPPNVALIVAGLLDAETKDNLLYLLLQGVFRYALENSLEVAVYAAASAEGKRKSYTQFCKEHSISGAILSGVTNDNVYLSELLHSRIPCVAVDIPLAGPGFGWVSIDNTLAARQIAGELFSRGHRRVTVVSGKENTTVNRDRMAGIHEAFRQAGRQLDREQVLYANFSEKTAYDKVAEYLVKTPRERHCTAFCCFSDIMALGVMAAVRDAGFRIPEDFSVTGFDGLAIVEYTSPALATVAQDMRSIGFEAGQLLQHIMQGGEGGHVTVPHRLLLRGSMAGTIL